MIKLIYSDSFGPEVGTGAFIETDNNTMKKSASIFNCDYSSMKPPKGHVGIHLVAFGAEEAYGPNRNADGFPKAASEKYHHTFVKYGHVFEHHCFPIETTVQTPEGSTTIEKIVTGDTVITHSGSIAKVTATHKTKAPDTLIEFTIKGMHNTISSTKNHPWLIMRRDKVLCEKLGAASRNRCYPHSCQELKICEERTCKRDPSVQFTPEWMTANNVRHEDYVCIPKLNKGNDTTVTVEDAYFLGLFFAEGCFHQGSKDINTVDGTFSLTFHKDEQYYIDICIAYCKHRGWNIRKPSYHKTNNTCSISCHDREGKQWLIDLFGGRQYSHTRKVPSKILNARDESVRLAFLAGWLDGDGSWSDKKQSIRGRSTSFNGLYGFLKLAHSCNICAYIQHDGLSVQARTTALADEYNIKPSGVLAIYGSQVLPIIKYSHKLQGITIKPINRTAAPICILTDEYAMYPISAIKEIKCDSEYVYNLEVDSGDHSYLVGRGFAVHNCNKDPKKKLGDIVKSAYNKEMDRVELFIHADENKAAKHLDKMEKEGSIAFSMACNVPNDRCSRCNTLRQTTKDPNQCDHVRLELGKMAEDGTLTYVHNDQPKFFDISFVGRPADRTAYGFKKVASFSFTSSTDLAKEAGIVIPESMLPDNGEINSRVKVIKKLAEYEKYIQKINISPSTAADFYYKELTKLASDVLSDNDINELRNYTPEVVFNKLADAGVILSVEGFYKYAFGLDYGDIAEYIDKCAQYTADNIFSSIQDNNDITKVATDNQFDKALPSYTTIPTHLINKIAFQYSFTDDVPARVVANTVCGKSPKVVLIKSSGTVDPTAKYLAYKYASYKAAMVDRILTTKRNINKQDVIALAVTQNLFN